MANNLEMLDVRREMAKFELFFVSIAGGYDLNSTPSVLLHNMYHHTMALLCSNSISNANCKLFNAMTFTFACVCRYIFYFKYFSKNNSLKEKHVLVFPVSTANTYRLNHSKCVYIYI